MSNATPSLPEIDFAPPRPSAAAAAPRPPRPAWIRAGLALIVSVYLIYSSFGVAAPFLWGHHGYHGGTYAQRARMTLRFHIVTPANWIGHVLPPAPYSYYLHHPIGYHHLLVPIIWLFGEHEWVLRGAAALGGLPLLFALFFLVRKLWSDRAALLACAVYVGLPILCSFSVLSDPMLPAMACCIVTVDAFLRYQERPSARFLATACVALTVGGLLMWEAYFQAFFHGLYALYWMRTPSGRQARVGRWNAPRLWFLGTFLCTASAMAFHFLFTWKVGMLGDFSASFHERHSASPAWVLRQHFRWLSLLYGRPLVGLGVLWLGLFLRRLWRRQTRRRDQAVLLFFQINVLYILLFAKGSGIHLYRVFWFSSFFALAVTDLICDLAAWSRQRQPASRRWQKGLAPAAVLAYFAAVLPHAYFNLIESREMMGTHGQPGYDPEYGKLLFAQEVNRRTATTDRFVNLNIAGRMEFGYYLDRSMALPPWGAIQSLGQVPNILKSQPRTFLLAEDRLSGQEQALLCSLLKEHRAFLFDGFLLLLLYDPTPEFHAYRFVPQTPSWAWRFFVSHKYPPMQLKEVASTYSKCPQKRN